MNVHVSTCLCLVLFKSLCFILRLVFTLFTHVYGPPLSFPVLIRALLCRVD